MSTSLSTKAWSLNTRKRELMLASAAILVSAMLGVVFDLVPRLQAITLGAVFLLLCGVILTFESFRRGHADLFSPLTLLTAYHAIGFGIKGLMDLATGASKIAGALDPTSDQFAELMLSVYAYAILAMLSLLAGDWMARRRESATNATVVRAMPLLPERSAMMAAVVGSCLTVGAISLLIARFGTVVLTDPSFVAVRGTFGLFWLYPLMHAAVYGWALLIVNRWAAGLPATGWHIAAMLFIAALVYAVTSSKAILLIAVLLLVVPRHRAVRRVSWRLIFALGGAFLLALPLFYLHRQSGLTAAALTRITPGIALGGAQIFLGRSYLADSFGAVLLYTPRVYPFRLGSNWLELFYFWVPRSIWPEKPLSLSLEFGHTYLSSFFTTTEAYYSPTLLGDAYMNLGPLGIVLVYCAVGYLLRRWYRWSYGAGARPETLVLYAVSAYWIGVGSEQSLGVVVSLSVSYLGIAALLAAIARGRTLFARSPA